MNKILFGFFSVWIATALYAENEKKEKEERTYLAIPYPNRSLYISKGLTAAIGFGFYRANGGFYNNFGLFQWQGEGSYYYTSYFSAGASAKIVAGVPTLRSAQLENRYAIFTRFHWAGSRLAAYLGPFGGVHLLEFSEDVDQDSLDREVDEPNAEYGVSSGLGWKATKIIGLATGAYLDAVAAQEILISTSYSIHLELLELWPHLKPLSKGISLSLEYQFAWVEDTVYPIRKNEDVWMLGLSVAF